MKYKNKRDKCYNNLKKYAPTLFLPKGPFYHNYSRELFNTDIPEINCLISSYLGCNKKQDYNRIFRQKMSINRELKRDKGVYGGSPYIVWYKPKCHNQNINKIVKLICKNLLNRCNYMKNYDNEAYKFYYKSQDLISDNTKKEIKPSSWEYADYIFGENKYAPITFNKTKYIHLTPYFDFINKYIYIISYS